MYFIKVSFRDHDTVLGLRMQTMTPSDRNYDMYEFYFLEIICYKVIILHGITRMSVIGIVLTIQMVYFIY